MPNGKEICANSILLDKYNKIITMWKLMVTDLVCIDRKLIFKKSL